MATPKTVVLRAPGTNCDLETAYAFQLAGGEAERIHINQLLESPNLLHEFQILAIPGGFSYGDDIAAGRILASQMKNHLSEILFQFREAGKLILGICNGFQVLTGSGLFTENQTDPQLASLAWNDSGQFEDRWVYLKVANNHNSPFLRNISHSYLPIAHAEGKFVACDQETLTQLQKAGRVPLLYTDANGNSEHLSFPENPNGSQQNIAGMTDPTGRVFGLMPHPERHLKRTNHPRWTRFFTRRI